MSKYYQNEFFHDSVKIRHLNTRCQRYLSEGIRLWDNFEATMYDEEKKIVTDDPPISMYDIALLQVTLSYEIGFGYHTKPVVASFSVDWKSDRSDFVHHVVRFDMRERDADIFALGLTEQECAKRYKKLEELRDTIDVFFDRIASTYTAHHLGWLNVSPETALYGIHDGLHHKSEQIKLPDGYVTLLLTLVSSVDESENDFPIEGVMDRIREHFKAFRPGGHNNDNKDS